MTTDLQKLGSKTFWQKPEGKFGKVVLGALSVAGGLLVYKYLPLIMSWLVLVLENAVYAAVLGITLIALTSPLWSSKMRVLVSYGFQSIMRAITGMFIAVDPIGILKNFVAKLKKNKAQLDEQTGNLSGQIRRLRDDIAENEKDAKQSLQMAGEANKRGVKKVFVLEARKAGSLAESNISLKEMLGRMEKLHGQLAKLADAADFHIQDLEFKIGLKEKEYKSVKASYAAFSSAMSILKGNPDERAIFEQTMEHLTEDAATKVGKIEHGMSLTEGFLGSVDLQNGVYELEALEKLNQLDEIAEQLQLGAGQQRVSIPETVEGETVPAGADGVYDLFKGRK